MMKPLIELKSIRKSYGNKRVLDALDLKVYKGDFLGILGVSGSGKSTLMNILLGIDDFDEGSYKLNNMEVSEITNLSRFRVDTINMIFQSYNLIRELTVRENILLPGLYYNKSGSIDFKRLQEVTDLLGLHDILDQDCRTLSGGEQQRVAIARSVYYKPRIIIADEPTGNLDDNNKAAVMNVLKTLNKQGTTVLLITHDEALLSYCSRVLSLKKGRVL